ncbi:hypothetical protein [Pseudonocardia sp. EC080625-04]|uniref:hypothetical protein n=1 Tax=Pseudonocardia sp. EC080625-04 TaxID=1096868 RepID=UPI000761F465|nr:hypothetical protein [Pseudonocardia sp. EC080625-04]
MDWLDETRFADIHTFVYSGMRFDSANGIAEFTYTHEGAARRLCFTEVVEFPLPENGIAAGSLEVFERALELLYVAVGTVYYKTVAPENVTVDAVALAPAAARWAEQLYRQGLAEFAYRWTLEHVLDLPVRTRHRAPSSFCLDNGVGDRLPVIGMGGGRDSIVALESVIAVGVEPATFTVTKQSTMPQLARGPGSAFSIVRRPDPRMTQMLADNVLRIGHVPVTAINSTAGVALSVLHGLGPVVMANERSAAEGNVTWRGRTVNHQWSKTMAAEMLFDQAVQEHVGVSTACFSLLGGLSELAISRMFASTNSYDGLLTSCNVAARSNRQDPPLRWCKNCAKCRFVFLGLAPFMDPARLVGIFGHDLLNDVTQLGGFRELVGLAGHKPFECVGEISEARVAVAMLAEDPRWHDAAVITDLAAGILPVSESEMADVWRMDPAPRAPQVYRHALERWPASANASQGGS